MSTDQPEMKRVRLIRFGPFQLDVRSGELRKFGTRVRLREQPLRILLLLLEHPGEIVLREEIRQKLWPNDTIVDFDPSINAAIKRLRDALSDSADQPHYIETVARRGYRFLSEVEEGAGELSEGPTDKQQAATEPQDDAFEGQSFSHFQVLDKLGSGGMGIVFRARDLDLGRQVALKFLPVEYNEHPALLARFRREARAAAALNHPNICTIYEIGQDAQRPFIAMELLEGSTLEERLRAGPIAIAELVNFAIQIADALEAAHSRGIIHRDVKPANIFVTRSATGRTTQIKILDFGMAKLSLEKAHHPETGGRAVVAVREPSMSASPIGTLAYMSPEQARAEELDARTDLFSFGAVLYEMAAGHRPFEGSSDSEIIAAIIGAEPAPVLPGHLNAIIHKALAKDRDARYQSAAEIRRDLESLESREAPHSRWKMAAVLAIAIIGLAAGAWWLLSRRAQPLRATDIIVLADFANSTGEPVFDETLGQALATEIQQSPFFSILPDRRVNSILKLMGSSAQHLNADTAVEVCQRAACRAVLAGSIAKLGAEYVVGINAVDCRTGASLAREQAQASQKERVLDALHQAARNLRRKLGESLNTVEKFDTHLEEATTPSLEALQAYSRGRHALLRDFNMTTAASQFQQAIQLDPNFAMAHLSLGLAYFNSGDPRFADKFKEAYGLRDRVSEWEKLAIESRYFHSATNDLIEARKITESWAESYPRDPIPMTVLGEIDADLGNYEKAIEEDRAAIRLDPEDGGRLLNLLGVYTILNRWNDARVVAEVARKGKIDYPLLHYFYYYGASLRGDLPEAARERELLLHSPEMAFWVLGLDADLAAYSGQFAKSRDFTRQLLAAVRGENEQTAESEAAAALREALIGSAAEARRLAAAALLLSKERNAEIPVALALALIGDGAGARALESSMNTRFPADTIVQYIYLPSVRALLTPDPDKAIDILAPAVPYELGPYALAPMVLYPPYLRGRAYLALHRGKEAAAEFEKICRNPGIAPTALGALGQLGVARAYRMQEDYTNARAAYLKFLTLWKNADPEIRTLKEARAEYRAIP